MVRVVLLLVCSNIFMTIAWYAHLRHQQVALWKVILISWLIALIEYALMIPANRWGAQQGINTFQLKMIQEVITLIVFSIFTITVFQNETFRINHVIVFCFLILAVYFIFKK